MMDSRKQKRLGPAPIASFEKSFEDTTTITSSLHTISATIPTNNYLANTEGIQDDAKDFYGNGNNVPKMMDTNGSKTTCETAITTKLDTTRIPDLILHGDDGSSERSTANLKMKQDTNGINVAITTHSNTTVNSSNSDVGTADLPVSFKGTFTLCTPSTPRIELSRASSSSHHEGDSRDSSPDNVFEQVGTGTLQETLDIGFREEGALELRSSTEELYFMDPLHKKEEEAKMQRQQQQQ